MAAGESMPFSRIRADVIRLVGALPPGRFTTYGSIAKCLGVNPRHVASVLARLDEGESARLPWHRVVAAEGRMSPRMDETLRKEQVGRLESEGIKVDPRGFILDPDRHFHVLRETSGEEGR